jgi:protein PhnA
VKINSYGIFFQSNRNNSLPIGGITYLRSCVYLAPIENTMSKARFQKPLILSSLQPKLSKPVMEVKDSNDIILSDGDSVTISKDLNVKGASTTLNRGTTVKKIRLTEEPDEVD